MRIDQPSGEKTKSDLLEVQAQADAPDAPELQPSQEESQAETPPPAPEPTVARAVRIPQVPAGPLTLAMRMQEPARTDAIEAIVSKGEAIWLQSITGEVVSKGYGEDVVIRVRPEPRPFIAQHAVHMMFYRGKLILEVPEPR
jgi:hypothetical protein